LPFGKIESVSGEDARKFFLSLQFNWNPSDKTKQSQKLIRKKFGKNAVRMNVQGNNFRRIGRLLRWLK
jgi:hypothetical protein